MKSSLVSKRSSDSLEHGRLSTGAFHIEYRYLDVHLKDYELHKTKRINNPDGIHTKCHLDHVGEIEYRDNHVVITYSNIPCAIHRGIR